MTTADLLKYCQDRSISDEFGIVEEPDVVLIHRNRRDFVVVAWHGRYDNDDCLVRIKSVFFGS